MRKCTIKIKLLRDSFENRLCDFAKEVDCIFAFINPFSVIEQKIMKMPSNIQMELLDFKTNVILKTKFDVLYSVPGIDDVINFWRSLPCENFPRTKKTRSKLYVCRFETTYTYNKHFRP